MAEKALAAVILEPCVQGISARPVDNPVKTPGVTGIFNIVALRRAQMLLRG